LQLTVFQIKTKLCQYLEIRSFLFARKPFYFKYNIGERLELKISCFYV